MLSPPSLMVAAAKNDKTVVGHRPAGFREVQTPTMDGLVKQGIELDRAYAYKFCSPTRSALQSGRLPVHVNTMNLLPNVNNPLDPVSGFAGIPRNMTGIAAKLREVGYRTHQVGKWGAPRHQPVHSSVVGSDSLFCSFGNRCRNGHV
jgi:arylsulfatase A-like enzyme